MRPPERNQCRSSAKTSEGRYVLDAMKTKIQLIITRPGKRQTDVIRRIILAKSQFTTIAGAKSYCRRHPLSASTPLDLEAIKITLYQVG